MTINIFIFIYFKNHPGSCIRKLPWAGLLLNATKGIYISKKSFIDLEHSSDFCQSTYIKEYAYFLFFIYKHLTLTKLFLLKLRSWPGKRIINSSEEKVSYQGQRGMWQE